MFIEEECDRLLEYDWQISLPILLHLTLILTVPGQSILTFQLIRFIYYGININRYPNSLGRGGGGTGTNITMC